MLKILLSLRESVRRPKQNNTQTNQSSGSSSTSCVVGFSALFDIVAGGELVGSGRGRKLKGRRNLLSLRNDARAEQQEAQRPGLFRYAPQAAWRSNLLTDKSTISGNGTTFDSVRHCLFSLRRLLAPHYAVTPVTADMLLKEPWSATCALLVIPGGADLGYCRVLNGAGNRRIEQFVRRGGAYLGLCAGGYYACKRCEFEVGDKVLEVVGDRELGFFPGTCRGGAFPGFVYHSEAGARAAELRVERNALTGAVPDVFRSYYNGGGVFVDAPRYAEKGVEVLASYTEELNVDPGEGAAAVVYCRIGDGAAILTGPHPECV